MMARGANLARGENEKRLTYAQNQAVLRRTPQQSNPKNHRPKNQECYVRSWEEQVQIARMPPNLHKCEKGVVPL